MVEGLSHRTEAPAREGERTTYGGAAAVRPPGRAAEPATGLNHACCCLSVTAGTTRDAEPLMLSMTRR